MMLMITSKLIPCGIKQAAPALSDRSKPIISLSKFSMDHVHLGISPKTLDVQYQTAGRYTIAASRTKHVGDHRAHALALQR